MQETVVLTNANIIDCTGRDPITNGTVVIENGVIRSVGPMRQIPTPRDATVIDLGGKTVLPGLIDAHAHVGKVEEEGNSRENTENNHPGAVYAYSVAQAMETTLDHGFTTVRDAGGCDWSFKLAQERGMIRGPRTFVSGMYTSQTGGHGDFRPRHDRTDPCARWHPIMPPAAVCDGVDEVRRTARDLLRTGSDQIKVMGGGGAASPTSLIDSPQFTVEELSAIVYEAKVVKKPVLAHVYVPQGIKNCIEAGVTTIEHGNFLDEETAFLMKENGVFLVPTLAVFELRSNPDPGLDIPDYVIEKLNYVKDAGPQSVEIADSVGIKIGSGSDCGGSLQSKKAVELELQARVTGPMKALISATAINAELMGLATQIGTVEVDKLADLIVVDGDPLSDIRVLQDPRKIPLIMQAGRIVKNSLR